MSLMTDTQGTPERVFALAQLIAARGGQIPRDEVRHWLDLTSADDKESTAVRQTVGAASSLGLVGVDTASKSLVLGVNNLPRDRATFSDWVHEQLVSLPQAHPDAVVLRAFAWFVANVGKHRGTTWLSDLSNQQIADAIRSDIASDEEGSTFNVTRYPRWRDWITFLGLAYDVPLKGGNVFYPYVTERLRRLYDELFEGIDAGQEMEVEAFLTRLSDRMPYLDNGPLFVDMTERVEWSPSPGRLSPVTSTALRDLHDSGVLELRMHGDARDAYSLSPDPTHRIAAFRAVVPTARRAK